MDALPFNTQNGGIPADLLLQSQDDLPHPGNRSAEPLNQTITALGNRISW
jgi:hypothetical protein